MLRERRKSACCLPRCLPRCLLAFALKIILSRERRERFNAVGFAVAMWEGVPIYAVSISRTKNQSISVPCPHALQSSVRESLANGVNDSGVQTCG